MSIANVKKYLEQYGMEGRVMEFSVSSATVELAAKAVGVEPARIAKTLSFKKGDHALLIAVAGDAKVDNRKFKDFFGMKAKMLSPQEAVELTGHAVGGVCPFDLPEGAEVYLDRSLQRFEAVYPAAGSSNSAVKLSCEELFQVSGAKEWIDVCKGWEEEE